MGQFVWFALCFLGFLIFGASSATVEDASDEKVAAKSPCPSGTLYFRHNCYEFIPNSVSWDSAEIACQNLRYGGHLASFSSMREEKVVSTYIRGRSSTYNVWIGLSATPNFQELIWAWSDGSPYVSGSPLWDNRWPSISLSSNDCVMLSSIRYPSSSIRWQQYPCDNSLPYVCKYKSGF